MPLSEDENVAEARMIQEMDERVNEILSMILADI